VLECNLHVCEENEEYDEIALIKAFNKHKEESNIPTASSSSSASSPAVISIAGNIGENPANSIQVLTKKQTDLDQRMVR